MAGRLCMSMMYADRRAGSSSGGGTPVRSGVAAPQRAAMLRLATARQQATSCRACGAANSPESPPRPQAMGREGAHRYYFRLSLATSVLQMDAGACDVTCRWRA